MRSMTFQIDDRSTGTLIPAVSVTVTENDDGTLSFTLTQIGPVIGDLRGIFFDVADESLIPHLAVTASSDGLTEVRTGDDTVVDLGEGSNMHGLAGSDRGYDVGLEIGTAGIGGDDLRTFSFTLGAAGGRALTLEDLANVDFSVRLTSVGEEGGERTASAKLLETITAVLDAVDDNATVHEDAQPVATGNVFGNDSGTGGSHSVIAVNGSATGVGLAITGAYGTVSIAADGTYTYTLDNAAVQSLAQGETLSEEFGYTVRSYNDATTFSEDSARLVVTIVGTNDGPVAEAIVQSANENGPAVTLNASYTDVDASDTHDFSIDTTGTLGAVANNGDGSFAYSANGAFEFLNVGQTATDTFKYTVTDNHGASSTQTATVTITGQNDAPVAAGDTTGVVYEDGSRRDSGQLSATDVDQGAVLTWSVDNTGVRATPDYRFLIDNFRIVRNGSQYYNDDFGDNNPPPSAPGAFGDPFPNFPSYGMVGTFTESGGRAILDGSRSIPIASVGSPELFHGTQATLLTDTSTDLSRGLKRDDSFTVEGRFDLVMPGLRQAYGVRLLDANGSDVVDVRVRRADDGLVYVVLREADSPANSVTNLASLALQPLAGENQIVLRLTHDASNPGAIGASFDLLGAATPRTFSFGSTVGRVFGTGTPADPADDEVWVRPQIVAVAPSDMQNGVYGTLHVDSNGKWNYVLDNGGANVQALALGEHATDTFSVRVTDEHGASATQTVTIDVVGSNDAPVISGPFASGFVVEDFGPSVATGQLTAVDPDHNAGPVEWTATRGVTQGPGGASSGQADYLVRVDELQIVRNGALLFRDTFDTGNPPPSAPTFAPPPFIPASYLTTGIFSEQGGKLVMDGSLASAFNGVANNELQAGHSATLVTDNNPADLTRGLKSDDSFEITARFDLTSPSEGHIYGITLNDQSNGGVPQDQLGENTLALIVRRDASGQLLVQFNELNVVADTASTASLEFDPLAGEDQIVLRLTHDKDHVGVVHASFDLVSSTDGTSRSFAFSQVRRIFGTGTPDYAGDDENWVRVAITTRAPDLQGDPDAGGDTYAGTFGTMHVDQTGAWTYTLDNGLASTQALAQNQFATDQFAIRAADQYGAPAVRFVPVTVSGSNDAPVATGGATTGSVTEDGALHAGGAVTFADPDLIDLHNAYWIASGANTTSLGTFSVGVISEAPSTADGSVAWNYSLYNDQAQYLAEGESIEEKYSVVVQDNFLSTTQDVTVTISGSNDPVAITAADAAGAVFDTSTTPASGTISFADVDLRDTHSATFVPSATNATRLGTFALTNVDEAPDAATGSVRWTYTVDTEAAAYLGRGDTATETYTVMLDDGHGSMVTQDVTITLTGTDALAGPDAIDDFITTGGGGSGAIRAAVVYQTPYSSVFATVAQLNDSARFDFDAQAIAYWDADSLAELSQYDVVLVGDTYWEAMTPQFWSALRQYNDGGGGVVTNGLTNYNLGQVRGYYGNQANADYDAVTPITGDYTYLAYYSPFVSFTGPSHPITDGLSGVQAYYYVWTSYFVDPDAVSLASPFGSGSALAYRDAPGAGREVYLGFTYTDGAYRDWGMAMSPAGDQLLEQAVAWSAGGGGAITEDAAASIPGEDLLANDIKAEPGDTLSIVSVSATSEAGAHVSLSGEDVVYDPSALSAMQALDDGETALDRFTYTITDQRGGTDSAFVTVEVQGRNDAPIGADDDNSASDDGVAVSGNVLANDSDVDIEPLFVANWGTHYLNHGTLSLNADGSYSYLATDDSLALGELAEDSFVYSVSDGTANGSATLRIALTGANDAPTASDDVIGSGGALRVAVLGTHSSSYLDAAAQLSDSTAFQIQAQAFNLGTYASAAEWTAALGGYDVVVTGSSGFFDAPQFQASQVFPALRAFVDGGGGVVTTGWFAYDLTNMGGMPTQGDANYVSPAAPFGYSYVFGGTVIPMLDPTHPIANGLSAYAVSGAYHELAAIVDPTASVLASSFGYSSIAYDEVGSGLTAYLGGLYLGNAAYGTSALRSGVMDQLLEQAVVWAAGSGSGPATDEDHVLTIEPARLLRNDSDVDHGDTLSVLSVSATSALGATVSLDAAGSIIYDPTTSATLQQLDDGQIGSDTFTYTIRDSQGATASATATVRIGGVSDTPNMPPVASPDTNAGDAVIEDGLVAFQVVGDPFAQGNVLLNDTDPDPGAVLSVVAVNGSEIAVGTTVQGTYGSLVLSADGTWSYALANWQPGTNALAQGETATEVFSYTVGDQRGATASSTLSIEISGSNDLPAGPADSGSVTEDADLAVSGQLTATDPDHGATLHWSLNGATSFFANYQYRIDNFSVTRNGSVIFNDPFIDGLEPPSAPNFANGTTAGYGTRGFFDEADGRAVMDGALAQTFFNFGVPGVGVTTSATLQTNTDSTNTANGLKDGHDFDIQGVFDLALPQHDGQVYGIGLSDRVNTIGGDDFIQLVVSRDLGGGARLSFREADMVANSITPIEDIVLALGAGDDQILLRLDHLAAQRGQIRASYKILDDGVETASGAFSQSGQIFGTETPNLADDERFTRATFFTLGTATDAIKTGVYGNLHLDVTTGAWDYTLNSTAASVQALAQGVQAQDLFQAIVFDEHNVGTLQDIAITVNGTNDAPVANPDTASTGENDVVMIDALANDTDVDDGAVLTLLSASAPLGQGTASISGGQVRFNPGSAFDDLAAGEQATVTLTYTARDEHGAQSSSTIDVTVLGEDDAPVDGAVFEDGPRRASGQLSTAGLDETLPLTATITGTGSGTSMANYRFLIDKLSIVRDGVTVFDDGFGNNQAPPSGALFDGVQTSYGLSGTFLEANGRAIMDGLNSFGLPGLVFGNFATLLTDTTTNPAAGLKQGHNFTVEGRFDLVVPQEEGQTYGIRVTDGVAGVGNDIVELAVRRVNGEVVAVLRELEATSPSSVTATILETRALNLAEGENRITLKLDHVAGSNEITASFVIADGDATRSESFTQVGHAFDGETWTRAQFLGSSPSIPQNGLYGNLSVDADGVWTYQTRNNTAALQGLAQDQQATDVFTVQLTDAHGVSTTQTVTIAATGTDDGPVILNSGQSSGFVVEDSTLTVRGTLFASDIDGTQRHWSVSRAPFFSPEGTVFVYDARYHFLLDELSIARNGDEDFFVDDFNDGVVPDSASYVMGGWIGEAEGKAIFDGSGAVQVRGVGASELRAGINATVVTNIDPADPTRGLKSGDSFTVQARFDLPVVDDSFFLPTTPKRQFYGIALTDIANGSIVPDQLGDDTLTVGLEADDAGNLRVTFSDRNYVREEVIELGSMPISVLDGETQIVFRLAHDAADAGAVRASFDLVGPTIAPEDVRSFEFASRGHIFGSDTPGDAGDDENWTRAQVITFGPDIHGQTQQGNYGTLSVDDFGTWTYALNNFAPDVQNLFHGSPVTDTFSVRVTDEYGLSGFRPVTITIVGTSETSTGPFRYTGTAANELLTGSEFQDEFRGGLGNDFLIGLGGADRFVYGAANEGVDTIVDFQPGAGGDAIDIRDVLAGSFVPGTSSIADFVQLTQLGQNQTLRVDANGPTNGANFVDLATLQGMNGLLLNDLIANQNLLVPA